MFEWMNQLGVSGIIVLVTVLLLPLVIAGPSLLPSGEFNLKKWLKSFGIIETTAILVVMAMIGMAGYIYFTKASPMISEKDELSNKTTDFVVEVLEGEYQKAYQRLSSNYRDTVSLKRFQRMMESRREHLKANSVDFRSISKMGENAAKLKGVVTHESGSRQLEVSFSKSDGEWWLEGLTIGSRPILPNPQ